MRMLVISIACGLWIGRSVQAQDVQHPILTSQDVVDGAFGYQHTEDIQVFADGRVLYSEKVSEPTGGAEANRSSYGAILNSDEMHNLRQILSLPEILSLPRLIPAKSPPIDFFWAKSLQIERSDGNQEVEVQNFYPFLNSQGPVYPQALIQLECALQEIKSVTARRAKTQNEWCNSLLGGTVNAQEPQECAFDESQPKIIAGEGFGPIRLGADFKAVQASVGEVAEQTYPDSDFRTFAQQGIEVRLERASDTVRAIFFYNGQSDTKEFGVFCGQTDKGINWQSSAEDVKRLYGRPADDFSGQDSGGSWERLVFTGIDFRFENGKMVRIGIPGR
jgi:hypothetical protein